MILQALVKQYDALQKQKDDIESHGLSNAKVSDMLIIDGEGEIQGSISLLREVTAGKKKMMLKSEWIVPYRVDATSGVVPSFLSGNCEYMLGLDFNGKKERALKRFEANKKLHMDILEGCESREAAAIKKFFSSWDAKKAESHPYIKEHWDAFKNMTLLILAVDGKFAFGFPEIADAWDAYYSKTECDENTPRGICLVTGKQEPIERIHPRIKGLNDTGATLASFDRDSTAFTSYGYEELQGINAHVSKVAAFKYTAAASYMINHSEYRRIIGDTTIVYWSEDETQLHEEFFGSAVDCKFDESGFNELQSIMDSISRGMDVETNKGMLHANVKFYILGISNNMTRGLVNYFYDTTFGEIIRNISLHHERMRLTGFQGNINPDISLYRLARSFCRPGEEPSDKHISALMESLLKCILFNSYYPMEAYTRILMRIFSERDEKDSLGKIKNIRISDTRVSFIKAFLLKNHAKRWGVNLQMALNENCNEIAYVLGRMFAVLEKIQLDTKQEVQKSSSSQIKDRYFTSACTNPSRTFPTLLKLANIHLAKIAKGNKAWAAGRNSKMLTALMDKITVEDSKAAPFPKRLNLDEQGAFIVGYYQQKENFYVKKEDNENE